MTALRERRIFLIVIPTAGGLGQIAMPVQHAGLQRLTTAPYQGVPITVVNMQRAVRQALELEQSAPVQRLVRQILASVRPADDVSEIAAINYWLLDNLKYLKDPVHVERVISPLVSLAPEPWDRAAGRRAGQGDCFPMAQKIICRSKSTGQYELVRLGDLRLTYSAYEALSYNFETKQQEFKDIVAFQDKGEKDVLKARLSNGTDLVATEDHKFWALDGQTCGRGKWPLKLKTRTLGEYADYFKWVGRNLHRRIEHDRILQAASIPTLDVDGYSEAEAYLAGIYAAEGYAEKDRWKTSIAQWKPEIRKKIEVALAEAGASARFQPPRPSAKTIGSGAYYALHAGVVADLLRTQGSNSFNMTLPMKALSGSREIVAKVLEAYGDGDGHRPHPGTGLYGRADVVYYTSSDELVEQLRLGALVLGRPFRVGYRKNHGGSGKRPIWNMMECAGSKSKLREEITRDLLPGLKYGIVKKVEKVGREHVGCITVDGNHNFFLADGTLASNCAALSMSSATLLAAAVMARGTRTSFMTVSMDPKMPEHHVFVVARLPNKQRLVLDPVAGPYVSQMLKSVVRYHEWPVEPVWTGRGYALGRAA